MTEADGLHSWCQASFERDLDWRGALDSKLQKSGLSINGLEQESSLNPAFDVFNVAMPTDRSKHDIGRYVLSHGIDVPLIDSMTEWRQAIESGSAMLRSDSTRDYMGMCGLLTSKVISIQHDIGIPEVEPGRPTLNRITFRPFFGDIDEDVRSDKANIQALLRGDRNPADIMAERFWAEEVTDLFESAGEYGITRELGPSLLLADTDASCWRYIPGINVRIFRDPIVVGKYYLGGREAHHEWTVTEGTDSADVEAHTKGGYRRGRTPETLQYSLPTNRIIDLYERVRGLPFFDQTQAPVMEMQLGDDGNLYFLQYLKTGQIVEDIEEFTLPNGRNSIICGEVRGATTQEGETLRIYLDPKVFTRTMRGAAVEVEFNMTISNKGILLQTAAMNSKVIITDHGLSFKDNHSDSAPLFRPPVAIDMWGGSNEAARKFAELNEQQEFYFANEPVDYVDYIEAIVTSNGRQATIESDWEIRKQYL